jgi:hypothetical protein
LCLYRRRCVEEILGGVAGVGYDDTTWDLM